ncbi:hypothetical protein [Lentzea sp.]|nr:hypothetical protein [Lentzea sp.]HUQ59596.1 hypothetical protein [Lentzea sp.]
MPDESKEPEEQTPEEIEVVAHSDDEDEELNAGCTFNSSEVL